MLILLNKNICCYSVFPEVTVHPENKLCFEGQAVTLCCKAEAKPSPQYEW